MISITGSLYSPENNKANKMLIKPFNNTIVTLNEEKITEEIIKRLNLNLDNIINTFNKYKNELWRYRLNISTRNSQLQQVSEIINDILQYLNDGMNFLIKHIEERFNILQIKYSNTVVSIYTENFVFREQKLRKGSILKVSFRGFGGVDLSVPELFNDSEIIPIRYGFAHSDEGRIKCYPYMASTQPWQWLIWSLLYPGSIHITLQSINLNKTNITLTMRLHTTQYCSLKDAVLNTNDEKTILLTLFGGILGDGTVKKIEKEKAIYLVAKSKRKWWVSVLKELNGWKEEGDTIVFRGNAAILTKRIIEAIPPLMKDLLDILSFEKWQRLKRLAAEAEINSLTDNHSP